MIELSANFRINYDVFAVQKTLIIVNIVIRCIYDNPLYQ